MLQVRLLGKFEAHLDDRHVAIPSRAGQSLFAFLLLNPGTAHRREKLAGLLWPDTTEDNARRNLRQELWRIRKAVQTDTPPGKEYLLTDDVTVAFNADSDYWLDVAQLERGARADNSPEGLAETLSLYRGELLPGFYDDWAVLERERLQALFDDKMEQLLEQFVKAERWNEVRQWGERWIALGSTPEPAYRALMLAHAASGDMSKMGTTYVRCVDALRSELGVEPSEVTRSLYERLARGEHVVDVSFASMAPALRRGMARAQDEPPAPGEPPFKGLQCFDVGDAALFFGRERLTAHLVERLRTAQFLAIIGASGCGKSSVVRAGLAAHFARSSEAAWRVLTFTPTAHPLEALAASLTCDQAALTETAELTDELARDPRTLRLYLQKQASSENHNILLVVDQFEELFTLCRDEFEREAFVDNLLAAIPARNAEPSGGIRIVLTLRADFYEHCAQYADLRARIAEQQEYIGAMNAEELRSAIEEPAKQNKWEFEPGLVDLILRDVGDEPGALPLLSHALLETWKRRSDRLLTLKGYAEAGGVRGAISRTAERVFNQELDAAQQHIARNIFLRLTELGEGTEDTRRRVTLGEFVTRAEDAEQVRAVLTRLADARLITTSEGTAEVAHEALIREWQTLREWLMQDREGLRLHRHLTLAAQEWEAMEREPGALYRGARLAQALEWSKSSAGELNPLEREFLDASREMVEREQTEREAQRQRELAAAEKLAETERRRAVEQTHAANRLRKRAVWLAGVLVIAGILALVALVASQQAAQNEASAQQQAATLLAMQAESELANGYHDRAVLLALEALEKYPYTPQAEHALAQAVSYSRALQEYTAHSSAVTGAAWSPDGKLVATSASSDNKVHIWDPATGKTVRVIEMPKGITGNKLDMALTVLWTPDGRQLLTLNGDRYTLGSQDYDLMLWDAESGQLISAVEIPNQAEPESGEWAGTYVNFATGEAAEISASGHLATLGGDNTAIIWDAAWQKPSLQLSGHTKGVNTVDWSPDETKLVTASLDGTARIWDAQTGQVLHTLQGHEGRVNLALWSPDGKQIATAGEDGSVLIWEPSTGELVNSIPTSMGTVWSLAWAPNRTRFVTGHNDGSVRIWETGSGKLLETLRGHHGIVSDLKWSPVDDRLISGDGNGAVRIWNAALSTAWRVFPPQAARGGDWSVQGASWSHDGRLLAMAGGDNIGGTDPPSFSLWAVQANKLMMENLGDQLQYMGVEAHFSPDDSAILYFGYKLFPDFSGTKTAYVFDARSGEIIRTFTPGGDMLIRSTAWSPDGSQIAAGGMFSDRVIIWNFQTGEQIATLVHSDNENWMVDYVEWSPDGSKFVSCHDDSTVVVWDAKTWQPLYTLHHDPPAFVMTAAWSPDGTRLLTTAGNDEQGAKDTTVRIWDSATGKELQVMRGHTKSVWPGDWSPNGKRIATFSNDGTVKVWDVATGRELLNLTVPVLYGGSTWWSPDGEHLAVVGSETLVSVWRVWQSTQELVDYAKGCCIIRSLTDQERKQFALP
jgi:WD40 repeat protein/DNA-binding SARP family transcriptional activator